MYYENRVTSPIQITIFYLSQKSCIGSDTLEMLKRKKKKNPDKKHFYNIYQIIHNITVNQIWTLIFFWICHILK